MYQRIWVARGNDREIEIRAEANDGNALSAVFISKAGQPLMHTLAITGEIGAASLRSYPVRPLYAALSRCDELGLFMAGFDPAEGLPEQRAKPRTDDITYAIWAERYVETITGGSSRPIADLAAEFGISPRAVRNYVHRARERGLLIGGRHRLPGGVLSERAKELLHE